MSILVGAYPSPHWPSFLLHFLVFYCFDFLEKVVGRAYNAYS